MPVPRPRPAWRPRPGRRWHTQSPLHASPSLSPARTSESESRLLRPGDSDHQHSDLASASQAQASSSGLSPRPATATVAMVGHWQKVGSAGMQDELELTPAAAGGQVSPDMDVTSYPIEASNSLGSLSSSSSSEPSSGYLCLARKSRAKHWQRASGMRAPGHVQAERPVSGRP